MELLFVTLSRLGGEGLDSSYGAKKGGWGLFLLYLYDEDKIGGTRWWYRRYSISSVKGRMRL